MIIFLIYDLVSNMSENALHNFPEKQQICGTENHKTIKNFAG